MLIGLCGGLCAGKKTVAQYLVDHHGFKRLYLAQPQDPIAAAVAGSEAGRTAVPAEAVPADDRLSGVQNGVQNGVNGETAASSTPPGRTFDTPDALLEFVTKRWRDKWVTTSVPTEEVLDQFARRPFFILISVDAPVTVRWRRYQARQQSQGGRPLPEPPSPLASAASSPASPSTPPPPPPGVLSLEAFVSLSDAHLYSPTHGLQPLISRAAVRLLNTSTSLAHLYATLGKLHLANPDRLRPSWDIYFMSLASLAAQRSNCMKRRVGCVLVGRERRVISTGYNGTPRGLTNCGDGGCGRCNDGSGSGVGLATCLCIHAEENALLEAGRERIREGSVLYCDTCPCLTCSIKICQVGISEVVYAQGYSMDGATAAVFREAGVKLRQFIPPPNGLIHLEKMELY